MFQETVNTVNAISEVAKAVPPSNAPIIIAGAIGLVTGLAPTIVQTIAARYKTTADVKSQNTQDSIELLKELLELSNTMKKVQLEFVSIKTQMITVEREKNELIDWVDSLLTICLDCTKDLPDNHVIRSQILFIHREIKVYKEQKIIPAVVTVL